MVAKISPSPSDNFFYRCFSLLTFFTLCVLIPSRRSLWIPLVTFKRAETSKQIRNKDQGHNLFDTDQHRLLITNFIDFLGFCLDRKRYLLLKLNSKHDADHKVNLSITYSFLDADVTFLGGRGFSREETKQEKKSYRLRDEKQFKICT